MKAFDNFLLWQEVVYYVVATTLGYSHYYIVAVIIIIVLLTSILVYGQTDGRTDGQSQHIRLLVCTDARSLKSDHFFSKNKHNALNFPSCSYGEYKILDIFRFLPRSQVYWCTGSIPGFSPLENTKSKKDNNWGALHHCK